MEVIMKYGARNQLQGRVVEIKKGTVMCQVKVKIPAESTISSVMTLDSLADLGIKEGDQVMAIAKAVNVLLTTE
jgi:molybdopterin-binding protein